MEIDVSKLSTQPTTSVNRLFVLVYSTTFPDKDIYRGFVKSVSSANSKGSFDVLAQHENFVTKLSKEVNIVPEEGEPLNYPLQEGVLEVANNVVRVFIKT